MDFEINGIPLHPLLVHAAVIIVPLAALLTILSAIFPRLRRRLGISTPLLALLALILVPITQAAGSWLYQHIDTTPAISRHMDFGILVLPWAIGLFLIALIQWLLHRRTEVQYYDNATGEPLRGPATAVPESEVLRKKRNPILPIIVGVIAVIVSLGAMFAVYQAGESGSRALWGNVVVNR